MRCLLCGQLAFQVSAPPVQLGNAGFQAATLAAQVNHSCAGALCRRFRRRGPLAQQIAAQLRGLSLSVHKK